MITPPTTIALSIRQPWAWLIVNGYKDVENRVWRTNFRGRFLVHASKKFDSAGYEQAKALLMAQAGFLIPSPPSYQTGGIVGISTVDDCAEVYDSPWFTGPFGMVLSGSAPLPFQPLSGKLNFFKVQNS